jgi:hypothetical protein
MLTMNRTARTRILVASGIVIILVAIGVVWLLLSQRGGAQSRASVEQDAAQQGAATASQLTIDRRGALDPDLPDDSKWVPQYPAGTEIKLDQSSWVQIGESASAYAQVDPPGTRVLVHFRHYQEHWYISEIETSP